MGSVSVVPNALYYGDNLDVLREHIPGESVDLIYLDPPFNSNATYNVLFKSHAGDESRAQIQAFDDTWHWGPQAEDEYTHTTKGGAPVEVARFIEAMRTVLGASDMLAYLVMMAPRLVELRRVLKPTGSIYLHCDPTASHYLKLLMDGIFGPENFRSEIIWKRTSSHGGANRPGSVHDVLLFYSKSGTYTWNRTRQDYDEGYVDQYYHYTDKSGRRFVSDNLTGAGAGPPRSFGNHGVIPTPRGRHWMFDQAGIDQIIVEDRVFWTRNGVPRLKQYLDEAKGMPLQDVWTDIQALRSWHKEGLGYPTQKPVALLERIIASSSHGDDTVLDPFCGCGTAVDAAQQLKRRWIGIDITYIAVDLIIKRLQYRYGDEIRTTFTTNGIPTDIEGTEALFTRNPFDFERWAVSMVGGQPNEKQVGDKGVDGRILFHRGGDVAGLAAVSVKGGKHVAPEMVNALVGAMGQEHADMGVLVTMAKPTAGMVKAANRAGLYEHPPTGNRYPRVQIITVPELFDGKHPNMPTVILPYIKASPRPQSEAVSLFEQADDDNRGE